MKRILTLYLLLFAYFACEAWSSQVPEFYLNKIGTNEKVSLSSYRGKVVLIDFWASWCIPCRVSFPLYNKLYAKYKDRGFEILALNTDSEISKAHTFLKDFPVAFTVLEDGKDAAKQLNLSEMPTSFLVNKDGTIIQKHEGFREGDIQKLDAEIAAALGE